MAYDSAKGFTFDHLPAPSLQPDTKGSGLANADRMAIAGNQPTPGSTDIRHGSEQSIDSEADNLRGSLGELPDLERSLPKDPR